LHIENDDDSIMSQSPIVFNDFLKTQLKTRPNEVLEIESALIELVHAVQLVCPSPSLHSTSSAQPGVTSSRSHSFRPMVSELRRIVHEYATHFHLDTVSYDAPPQRNVVVIAKRYRPWDYGSVLCPAVFRGLARLPQSLLSNFNNAAVKPVPVSTVVPSR
jgi:hypothetical protein